MKLKKPRDIKEKISIDFIEEKTNISEDNIAPSREINNTYGGARIMNKQLGAKKMMFSK